MDFSRLVSKRHWDYIPITNFPGFILADGTPNLIRSAFDGTSNFTDLSEVTNSGIVGAKLLAINKGVNGLFAIPSWLDRSQDLKMRVIWTSATTGTESVIYRLNVGFLQLDSDVLTKTPTAYAAAAQAAAGVAYTVQRGNAVTVTAPAATDRLMKVLITAPTLHADLISDGTWILGLEIEYGIKFGRLRPRDGRAWAA